MPNERLIYEWLGYPEPYKCGGGWFYLVGREDCFRFVNNCPPLDMNTAFAEAIPKLRSEGVKVCYANPSIFDDESAPWYLQLGDKDPFIHPDFWEALTDYLEAKDA